MAIAYSQQLLSVYIVLCIQIVSMGLQFAIMDHDKIILLQKFRCET